MKAKLVVCASGEGTNFEAIVEATKTGVLDAQVVGLITNRSGIGAVDRAKRLGVPVQVLRPKEHTAEEWDGAMTAQVLKWQADWIILAGFLARIGPQMLQHFPQRIVNSHPALLPKFGGHGMYGSKVHAAVLSSRVSETGVTIHTIDGEYDRGTILAQACVPVHSDDTVTTLEARVKALEVSFYPKVLNDLVTGRITMS